MISLMSCFFHALLRYQMKFVFFFSLKKNLHFESKQTIQIQICQLGSFARNF